MAATAFSLIGALAGFTEVNDHRAHKKDSFTGMVRKRIDFKALLNEIKLLPGMGAKAYEAGDKFAVIPVPKGAVVRLSTVHVLKGDTADLACVTVGSDTNAAAYSAGADIGGSNAPVTSMATTALPAVFLANGAVCLGLLDDATHDFPTDAVIEIAAEVLRAPAGVLANAGAM